VLTVVALLTCSGREFQMTARQYIKDLRKKVRS